MNLMPIAAVELFNRFRMSAKSQVRQAGDEHADTELSGVIDRPSNCAGSSLMGVSLSNFFELCPDMFSVIGFDGRFLAVNAAWETHLGFAREEILGERWESLVHPDDLETMDRHKQQVATGPYAASFQSRCRSKTGQYRWLWWNQVTFADERVILTFARDITAAVETEEQLLRTNHELKAELRRTNSILLAEISHRRQIIEELSHAREEYRGIFENAIEGIVQLSAEGKYRGVNGAYAQIQGYNSPAQLIAETNEISEGFVDPGRWAQFKGIMQGQGVAIGFEYEAFRRDGCPIWLSMDLRPVRDRGGAVLYWEGMVEDITDRRSSREQMWAAQKLAAAGQLVATIARDFTLAGANNLHAKPRAAAADRQSPA